MIFLQKTVYYPSEANYELQAQVTLTEMADNGIRVSSDKFSNLMSALNTMILSPPRRAVHRLST